MASGTSSKAITLFPSGGTPAIISGSSTSSIGRLIDPYPVQIIGFDPLTRCDENECRSFNGGCYISPVFGTVGTTGSTYENDLTSYFIDDQMERTVIFVLQKLDIVYNVWNDLINVASTSHYSYPFTAGYGTFFNYGDFPAHPTYIGFQLNWGSVITINGGGIYRIKIYSPAVILGGTPIDPNPYLSKPNPFPYCYTGSAFRALPFSCDAANYTVKFEANASGKIGSHLSNAYVFDLCGINLYDSVRVNGIFKEVNPTVTEEYLEYQNGLMDLASAEIVLKYQYESKMLPEYVYKRLFVYGTLTSSLFASDYNFSNARNNIKLLPVVMKSIDVTNNKSNRQTSVVIPCESGIQSIIKSTSCDPIQ